MLAPMSIPVFTTLVLGALVTIGGCYIVSFGWARLKSLEVFSDQDLRTLGLVHILVGGWFLVGAATEDPNTTLGACMLMTKVRYCLADGSY